MDRRWPSQKEIAMLVVVSLALLTSLGMGSGPPEVALTDIPRMNGGEVIRVRGIVVDAWYSDTGTLGLVLGDLDRKASLKIVCSRGVSPTHAEIHIGDEVRATGEFGINGEKPVLWSTLDDVELLRPSREVLTLDSLANAWELLVGDRFEITGILTVSSGGMLRLMEMEGTASIALVPPQPGPSRFEGRKVLVDAVLRMEPQTMELALAAHGISACA